MKGLRVRTSYAMDVANLLSVLTGQEVYVREHRAAFEAWSPRLSEDSKAALREALARLGSPMLGPPLCLWVSAVPGFDDAPLVDLLADPERIREHFRHTPYYAPAERWPVAAGVCQTVAPVVRELEALGFRRYWEAERRPLIEAAIRRFRAAIDPIDFDVAGAVAGMLGPPRRPVPATLLLGSFVAPHGVKVCGPVFLVDLRERHPNTVRTALHELFHPPYREEEVAGELAVLAADPLVRSTFEAQAPGLRYATVTGWIEENLVEAMAHTFAAAAGFAGDPAARYHLDHDGQLSVVLLAHLERLPKSPDEPFAAYFKRLVAAMPVGHLDREYAALRSAAAGPNGQQR